MISEILTVVFVLVCWVLYRDRVSRPPPGFPPGPSSVPLIGSVPFFGKDFAATYQKWRSVYGSVYGFNFAGRWTVMLSDPALIKEAYEQEVFSGRPDLPAFMVITGG